MRIDKLELIGFKSFADKTIFNFHPGITCIVGPNGCGKSNIVDAFRWVLGEQSAKSLRGEKMEEVIFNGSVSKKPKGMADVTMFISGIDNIQTAREDDSSDGGSVDSVSVTRRLYRSGDSDYMLNKSLCRLKDIKDLFLDTGLEVKSYSILEQDRIAEILNAKPLDRRFIIEEIAGVMKYNARKKEAISKLESSRANLQRINDIVIEVKKQINFLDRIAKKAERYKKLTLELNAIELKIAKRDFQGLAESHNKIISEYNLLKEEDSLQRAELSNIENQAETKRLQLLEKEKALEEVQAKLQNLEKEIAELEKSIAVERTEKENYGDYLTKLFQQNNEYNAKATSLLEKQKELEKTEGELVADIESQREILKEKADFLRSMEEELTEKEDLLERKRHEIFRISEELSNLKNNQSRLQSSLEGLQNRETNSIRDSENIKAALAEIDNSLKELESNLLEKNNDILLLNEKKGVLINEINSNKKKTEELRESLSKLKEELASNTSRINSLEEILFQDSAKELFSGDQNSRLLAMLSDIIEIENEYEKAIESALSEKVNSFILPTFNDIEIAVSALKEKGLGRTAFLAVDLTSSHAGQTDVPEGSLGRAISFVQCKDDFSSIVRNILEDIFIVKDLKTAYSLISAGRNSCFVTLEGEVIEPSGAIIAGEIKGIFKRKREIRELESIIEDSKIKIQNLQSEFESIRNLIETKESELRNIEAGVVEKEKEASLLKMTAENFREEKDRRSRKLAYLTLEIEQLTKEKESTEKLLMEKEGEIQLIDSKKTASEQQVAALQDAIFQKRVDLEEYRTEVTDLRLTITSLKERIDSITKEKENTIREIEEHKQKKDFLSQEIASVQARIAQRGKEIEENEMKVKSLVSVADEFKRDISGRKEVIETENQELLDNEQNLRLLRGKIDTASQRLSELDVQKAEHKLKMENLAEHIQQNYGLAIESVEVEPLTEDDEKRLEELREKIREVGPVNLGTLDEYEELRQRYEFLKNQEDDLNRSIAELEEAIKKINTTTRKKLREAFEALKTKFSEVFTTLFGGGRAELILTDENNILETGVDIIAQPPGKRLQNINLLSGGEKALTALSLLFASFLVKPTPLCILDEADSALDEMNTDRFARTIQELAKDTQFIVVTHNRSTMSIADYIYGITMEEAGVSKVISMQLVEA